MCCAMCNRISYDINLTKKLIRYPLKYRCVLWLKVAFETVSGALKEKRQHWCISGS